MWFGCHSYAISARCNWNGWDVSIPLCTTILCVGAVRAWVSAHATPVALTGAGAQRQLPQQWQPNRQAQHAPHCKTRPTGRRPRARARPLQDTSGWAQAEGARAGNMGRHRTGVSPFGTFGHAPERRIAFILGGAGLSSKGRSNNMSCVTYLSRPMFRMCPPHRSWPSPQKADHPRPKSRPPPPS